MIITNEEKHRRKAIRDDMIAQAVNDSDPEAIAYALSFIHGCSPESVWKEVINNNFEGLKKVLKTLDEMDINKEYNDDILLVYASKHGYIDIMKLLIEKGAEVNIEDADGMTPLYWAAINNNAHITKFLIEDKGAEVDYEGINSTTALIEASKHGYIDIVKLLIANGANINIKASVSKTPLHYAVNIGYMDIAEFLIKEGAVVDVEDGDGMTPLHYAVEESNRDMIKFLIDKGADINSKNRNGEVALKYPYDKDDKEMVEFMLENGADENNIYREGKTFLEHARYTNKKWFIDLILKTHSLKNPKRLVEILTDFTNETPIKYTTHDWKNRIPEKYNKNFSEFLNDVKQQFSKIEDELKKLSPNLHQTIYDFIINEKNTTSWSSFIGLEEYVNNGGEPSEYKINGISFGDIINEFKHKIEFRNNEDQLRSIFDKWKDTLGRSFKLNIDDSLNGIAIYTDTKLFTDVIDDIFKDIQEKRSTFKEIEVKLTKPDFNYVELYIMHKNSKANRSAEDMLERFEFEKGDIQGIGKNLSNLCDWSIESADSDGKPYRVNYLKSEDIDSIEPPQTVSIDVGFTHIFRFYK